MNKNKTNMNKQIGEDSDSSIDIGGDEGAGFGQNAFR